MKRNKIAAGALALAMGLSAVAPSFAAEGKDTKPSEYTYDYKKAKEEFVKEWNKVRNAEKNLESAKASEATAEANYEKALQKLAELEARYGKVANDPDSKYQEDVNRVDSERQAAIQKYEGNISSGFTGKPNYDYLTEKYLNNFSQYIDQSVDQPSQEAQAEAIKDIISLNERKKALKDEYKEVENKRSELQSEVSRRLGDYNEAKNKTQEAKNVLAKLTNNAKTGTYDKAKAELISEGLSVDTINKAEKSGDINIVIDAGKEEKPSKKAPTKEELAELDAAIQDAKATLKAVDILKKKAEHISDKNEAYLNKLVKEANELIKKGEAALKDYNYKKVAFSVFSTAYAAEEEAVEEEYDVKDLTNKIRDKDAELQDAIEAIDKEEEIEDKKEEDKKDNKEDKKDNKEDKEDKKDNKEDKEDKKDNKEEDKKDEKVTNVVTPSKKASSNRTAGRNAKTGIAGVAGVAGVLAAASVAYAASKKNN
ncbi:hypothetical protein [Anaerococcus nagyae]|uniref:hypothetical protein n=2 Tax=Anaerococcus nagyae TaxID=1755241 RepID=UPI00373512D4